MKGNITVSLIISTYNWAEALELVLLSLSQQTVMPLEVIIADDGSRIETRELIEHYQKTFAFPLVHIWHEDKGFRLAKIRNEAIKVAKGNYIIQIDGDIILHKDFVKDHMTNARVDHFISGSRVLLGEKLSGDLLKSKTDIHRFFSKETTNLHYAFRLPLLSLFFKKPMQDVQKVIRSVRGCNMSFWKKDLLQINGYNEAMIGWGREDSEISARLINIGLSKISLKFSAIQHHIYHPSQSKEGLNSNDLILEKTIKERIEYTVNGIDKNFKPQEEKIKLSAIIPTLNEASNIAAAINTLRFADEIIVIDSYSSDETVALAEKMGAKVILRKFDDFSTQKNYAIDAATHDWIYILDADERVSRVLKNEIIAKLKTQPDEVAFSVKMKYYFMGKLMKHGSFKTKTVTRLFNKAFCRYDGRPVHEQLITNGKTAILEHYLDHDSDKSVADFVQTQNFYAGLKANELLDKNDGNLFIKTLFKPPFRFIKHFIIQLGFLDGFQGVVFAGIQSYGVFMRYVKLWEMKHNSE